ncbi:MAG: outer membrane protein assembly factor BamD [Desulfonatronovibrionaceae bacterium]
MLRRALFFPLVAAFCLCLSGCGFIDYYFLEPPEDTAQELAEAGYSAMHEEDYGQAIDYFTKLKDRYPFSPYTAKAEVSLGDAYFMDKQYKAAVEIYKEFESLHPRHEAIPYVLYQIGVANYEQFRSLDLPQTNMNEALEYFRRVKESYPNTEYAEASEEYIQKCRRFQAEHEVYVADLYWRMEKYLSAWKRYEYITEEFGDIEDISDYATRRGELAYFLHQKDNSKKELEKEQGSWKQWFDWL